MTSAAQPLFMELEDAMSGSSSERRVDVLRRVTDLFLAASTDYSEAQVALFDDVILQLSDKIETSARIELSRRLAAVPTAPARIIHALADDDVIDVAGPVLSQSERLSEAALVDYAQRHGTDHLVAIAKRPQLSQAITDALLDRDDHRVTRSVAENHGARFSPRGFGLLVERSHGNDALAEIVAQRPDIPQANLRTLIAKASETVLRRLSANYPGGNLQQVLAEITGGLDEEVGRLTTVRPAAGRDYTAAIEEARLLHAQRRLDDRTIWTSARAGHFEQVVAALNVLTAMPVEALEGLMSAGTQANADLIVLVTKAAGLTWPTARAILMLRPGSASRQDIDSAEMQFERLQVGTARRVLRFHQVRQAVTAK